MTIDSYLTKLADTIRRLDIDLDNPSQEFEEYETSATVSTMAKATIIALIENEKFRTNTLNLAPSPGLLDAIKKELDQ